MYLVAYVLKAIVVVGGSCCGTRIRATYIVDHLAPQVHRTHHVIMIEENSHIQKAFIPLTDAFNATPPHSTSIVRGIASAVLPNRVVLACGDHGNGDTPVGTRDKGRRDGDEKGVADRMREAQDIVVVGGGAYGIQLVFDTKEFYPSKRVTLVHSRFQLMPRFHPKLHSIVAKRATAVGVNLVLGQRVRIPPRGFPTAGPSYTVELVDGRRILRKCFDVACIGGAPLLSLSPSSVDPRSKVILVKPTLQVADPVFPRVFAIGDVAATGAHKAAALGHRQAAVAVQNIVQMTAAHGACVEYVPATRTSGSPLAWYHSYVTFKNPATEGDAPGVQFCRVQRVWERRAPGVTDYYL
ncbi:hypothetical protein C8R44DRAFT_839772 [Mycena epipterygia]|nr:hypothetical protein C8R44DRAFT_839772 [Mycena epipterygia]